MCALVILLLLALQASTLACGYVRTSYKHALIAPFTPQSTTHTYHHSPSTTIQARR